MGLPKGGQSIESKRIHGTCILFGRIYDIGLRLECNGLLAKTHSVYYYEKAVHPQTYCQGIDPTLQTRVHMYDNSCITGRYCRKIKTLSKD